MSKGLFRGCISQSGGSFAPWSDKPRSLGMDASQKGAEQQGVAFQKHLKKKSLKELRKMDAMALCDGNVGFSGFWPCVDGYVITDDQYRLYERGEYNDVPIIVMTNSDEGALFAPGNMTAENYQMTVKGIFGDWADEALKVYPGSTDDEAWHGFGDAFRDMGFAWPSYAWVSLQAKTGKSPAYAAFLAQPSEVSFSQDPRRRGVAHADDIMFLNDHFTNLSATGSLQTTSSRSTAPTSSVSGARPLTTASTCAAPTPSSSSSPTSISRYATRRASFSATSTGSIRIRRQHTMT